MRALKVIESRSHGDNARRVNVPLAIVARLDQFEIRSLFDARPLVELAQVVGEIGVVLKAIKVTLEMTVVNEIESQQCRKGPPVGLGDSLSNEIAALGKPFLQGIEAMEHFADRLVVSPLSLGKSRTVNTVVQVLVHELIHFVDFAAQLLGVKIETGARPGME